MKWLLGLIVAVAVLIGAALGLSYYFLPTTTKITRSVEIDRPAAIVYPLLINLRTFNEYSPWYERDPKADYMYDGPAEGVGQTASWNSSIREIGEGTLTIAKAVPNERVDLRIALGAGSVPFAPPAQVLSTFTLAPAQGKTKVTWSTAATCPAAPTAVGCRIATAIAMFDLGVQFRSGLDKLKKVAEQLPTVDIADLKPQRVAVERRDFVYVESAMPRNPDEFRAALHSAFTTIDAFFAQSGITRAGAPMAVTVRGADGRDALRAGAPFEGPTPVAPVGVKVGKTPGGPALKVLYVGDYAKMSATYDKIDAYVLAHRLEPAGAPWEVYVDDPDQVPADQVRTEVYFPVQ